jgi:PBP1b-binding outer membrane lipoprotein LpoB
MRFVFSILFGLLLVPLLFAGCTNKKAAEMDSGPRLAAPPQPVKQTDKPTQNMPPAPPPPPAQPERILSSSTSERVRDRAMSHPLS